MWDFFTTWLDFLRNEKKKTKGNGEEEEMLGISNVRWIKKMFLIMKNNHAPHKKSSSSVYPSPLLCVKIFFRYYKKGSEQKKSVWTISSTCKEISFTIINFTWALIFFCISLILSHSCRGVPTKNIVSSVSCHPSLNVISILTENSSEGSKIFFFYKTV
jgi:hypothetical protein